MRQTDHHEPATDGGPSMSVPLGPVVPDRRLPTLPLLLAVTIALGAIAFLAGLQVGDRSGTRTIQVAAPSARPTPVATQRPTAMATPVAVMPGQSEFARSFAPLDLIAGIAGGSTCVGESMGSVGQPRSGVSSATFASAWMAFCPLPAARRVAFVNKLCDELARVTPSLSSGSTADDRGQTFALLPYGQTSFLGSVTMAAVVRGAGLEISITLEEHAAPDNSGP